MNGKLLHGLRKWWASAFSLQNALPCVGIVVFAGCVTFLIAPDDLPSLPGSSDDSGLGLPMVIVDPGHGGNDDGAKGNGLVEKELTFDLALRTARLLKVAGFRTTLTREDDTYVSLEKRAQIANKFDDALFVSIHFNKDGDRSSTGIETFYAREKLPLENSWTWVGFFSNREEALDTGENLAGAVQACLATRTEAKNRGIRARDLYVVRHVRCPSVLVEGGFMSNAFEAQLLKSNDYRERIAMGIAEGIMTYQKSRPRSAPASQPRLAQADR
ncbi:N-acetylmuramoyl-L-alanine amidase [Verrucomicrobiota bacterium sgz303538]